MRSSLLRSFPSNPKHRLRCMKKKNAGTRHELQTHRHNMDKHFASPTATPHPLNFSHSAASGLPEQLRDNQTALPKIQALAQSSDPTAPNNNNEQRCWCTSCVLGWMFTRKGNFSPLKFKLEGTAAVARSGCSAGKHNAEVPTQLSP